MRSALLLLHRYAGLLMAGFLIITGLTGALLAFNHEIDEWLNPDWMHVQPQNSPVISLNQLNQVVQQAYPYHQVEFVSFKREPDQAFSVRIGPLSNQEKSKDLPQVDQVFVNPYTGKVLGARELGVFDLSRRGVMPFLFKFHYTLHLPDKWGRWLLGGIAIIWLFDCFVGFYLTLPKITGTTKVLSYFERWNPAWKIKRGGSAVRINYDTHRASGLWLWPLLFVTAFTSIYFNLNKEVFKPVLSLVTSFSPHPTDSLPKVSPRIPQLNLDDALKRGLALRPISAQKLPVTYLSYSSKQNLYRLSFDEREANAWFKFKREQVFFDGDTGELKAIYGYANGKAGDKFGSWQYPLHSGQMFGLPGRILILLTGLVTAVLSITGVYIWYRKRVSKKAVVKVAPQPSTNIRSLFPVNLYPFQGKK